MKAMVRHLTASLAARAGLISSLERSAKRTVTILCYHRVLPAARRAAYHDPDLVVTPEVFRAHCQALAENYVVATLASAIKMANAPDAHGKPIAVITFDDGYRDNFRYAAPILLETGLQATFFIVSGLVDSSDLPWYDRAGKALQILERGGIASVTPKVGLAQAKSMLPHDRLAWVEELVRVARPEAPDDNDLIMTSDQLRKLHEASHEIGSHTVTHPILPQSTDDELEFEVRASRERLGEIVGADIESLSYPNGDSDVRVESAARYAGYKFATIAKPGVNALDDLAELALNRWFIDQERLSDARGRPSAALLRMELVGLAHKVFNRKSRI